VFAEFGKDRLHVAQQSSGQHLAKHSLLWQKRGPKSLHTEHADASRSFGEFLYLTGIKSKRFLDQRVLAGLNRE